MGSRESGNSWRHGTVTGGRWSNAVITGRPFIQVDRTVQPKMKVQLLSTHPHPDGKAGEVS